MTDIVSPMPATPGEVLDVRPVCQVVIGDFGRDAAVRYLSALSRSERRFLQGVLAPCGLPFFDEYRRITWVALAEVAFIKAELIESVRRRDGHLTDQVLLGEAWSAVPESVMEALVELVMTAVAAVVSRGYERVRVVLPCNSLGGMLTEVGRRVVGRLSADGLDLDFPSVAAVVARALRSQLAQLPLLVLGATGAQVVYEAEVRRMGGTVVQLRQSEQRMIERLVLSCVAETTEAADARVLRGMAERAAAIHGPILVLQACTDFDFGVGVDALRIFADEMVKDCYGTGWLAASSQSVGEDS